MLSLLYKGNASVAVYPALKKRATKLSDLEMYEDRMDYCFEDDSQISDVLPCKSMPIAPGDMMVMGTDTTGRIKYG